MVTPIKNPTAGITYQAPDLRGKDKHLIASGFGALANDPEMSRPLNEKQMQGVNTSSNLEELKLKVEGEKFRLFVNEEKILKPAEKELKEIGSSHKKTELVEVQIEQDKANSKKLSGIVSDAKGRIELQKKNIAILEKRIAQLEKQNDVRAEAKRETQYAPPAPQASGSAKAGLNGLLKPHYTSKGVVSQKVESKPVAEAKAAQTEAKNPETEYRQAHKEAKQLRNERDKNLESLANKRNDLRYTDDPAKKATLKKEIGHLEKKVSESNDKYLTADGKRRKAESEWIQGRLGTEKGIEVASRRIDRELTKNRALITREEVGLSQDRNKLVELQKNPKADSKKIEALQVRIAASEGRLEGLKSNGKDLSKVQNQLQLIEAKFKTHSRVPEEDVKAAAAGLAHVLEVEDGSAKQIRSYEKAQSNLNKAGKELNETLGYFVDGSSLDLGIMKSQLDRFKNARQALQKSYDSLPAEHKAGQEPPEKQVGKFSESILYKQAIGKAEQLLKRNETGRGALTSINELRRLESLDIRDTQVGSKSGLNAFIEKRFTAYQAQGINVKDGHLTGAGVQAQIGQYYSHIVRTRLSLNSSFNLLGKDDSKAALMLMGHERLKTSGYINSQDSKHTGTVSRYYNALSMYGRDPKGTPGYTKSETELRASYTYVNDKEIQKGIPTPDQLNKILEGKSNPS